MLTFFQNYSVKDMGSSFSLITFNGMKNLKLFGLRGKMWQGRSQRKGKVIKEVWICKRKGKLIVERKKM